MRPAVTWFADVSYNYLIGHWPATPGYIHVHDVGLIIINSIIHNRCPLIAKEKTTVINAAI